MGRWKSEPVVARTTLGLYGSTVRPVRMTASAPAASAARMIVPRLPGSRTSSQIATRRGDAANTSRTEVGVWRATATMPCGVTVSAMASSTPSVVKTTSMPASRAASRRSAWRSSADGVANISMTVSGRYASASRAACGPSSRNSPVS